MGTLAILPRRAFIAAVLAAAVVVVAWHTGGFFTPEADARNLTAVRILTFVVLGLGFYVIPAVVRRARRGARIAFVAWTAYLGLWLFSLWPGVVMTDTAGAVQESRRANVFEWFSWVHSVLNISILDLVPHVGALAVLQIVLAAVTMAYATQVLLDWRRSVPAAIVMNLVAALSVPVVDNALLISRDTPFALGHVVLSLAVAQLVTRQREATATRLAGIAVLTGILSVYRGDGIVLLGVVPILLAVTLRPSRGALVRGLLAFAGAWVLFAVALPAAFKIEDQSRAYAVSLRINPLGAVLRTNFYSENKDHDLRELGRVINVAEVRDTYVPSEIPAFWTPTGWNRNASDADFAAFRSTADHLLLENMTTVLGGRLETFGAATGLGPGQFTGMPYDPEDRFAFLASQEGIGGGPPSDDLYDAAQSIILRTDGYSGAISTRSALFWNFLPWMALLLVTLPFWRRIPFVAAVSLLLLCRVPVVFLVAPAAQFKYYLSVELGGIVVLGLLLALIRREQLHAVRTPLRARSAGPRAAVG